MISVLDLFHVKVSANVQFLVQHIIAERYQSMWRLKLVPDRHEFGVNRTPWAVFT